MKRFSYSLLLLIPMIIYYLMLNQIPTILAKNTLYGWPLSLILGVVVMFWGVLIGAVFSRQMLRKTKKLKKGE